MTQIASQTFTFSPPQQDAQAMTQTGSISGVYIDGSQSLNVPFTTPFTQVCNSVSVQYTPTTDTGYQLSTEVLPLSPATSLAASLTGFTLVVRGGPIGVTDNFSFQAVGI